MIEQVASALERQDYQEATRLLEALPADDLWVQLYQGQLYEMTGRGATAEAVYRQLLQTATGFRLTVEARRGLQRIEALAQEHQQLSIAKATVDPRDTKLGLLVLEAVSGEAKTLAAQKFAQIMKVEPYFARLQLPSQGWRLYRTGPIGELRAYGQVLQGVGIPVFWLPFAEIQQIQVLQVCYFQVNDSQVTIVYTDPATQSGSFTFSWSEVTQRVTGLLPLFEEVVDSDARGKLQRKQKIQDHAQICDLHLPGKNCILRLYDSGYQFQRGIDLTLGRDKDQVDRDTSWANWKHLMGFLNHSHQAPVWSDFKFFVETALEQVERLDLAEPHINLFRREESAWDQSFHLYSCLVFLKYKKEFGEKA